MNTNWFSKHKIIHLFGGFSLALAAIAAYELGSLARFPQPSGPYRAAVTDFSLTDETRADSLRGYRELQVRLYYPTTATDGERARYHPHYRELNRQLSEYLGLPGFLLRRLTHARPHSLQDAPHAALDTLKLAVFSHGYNGTRSQSTFLMEELASHGYLVAAIEHLHYSCGWIAINGQRAAYSSINPAKDFAVAEAITEAWSTDQIFVKDKLLERFAAERRFYPLNREGARLFVAGHSFGGSAAIRTMCRDSAFAAAINLDGFYFGSTAQVAYGPILELRSDAKPAEEIGEQELAAAEMSRAAYQYLTFDGRDARLDAVAGAGLAKTVVEGANHLSFTDLMLAVPFKWALVPRSRAHYRQIAAEVKAFLERTR
jgi:predicted dienelactone hydrolase